MRVVFDTNTLVSALLFRGSMAWLVGHWQSGKVTPLTSRETAAEFMRVLAYPKFGLGRDKIDAVAAHYLPFAERFNDIPFSPELPVCRDARDQMFLDLAAASRADILVTGDADLLALRSEVTFLIETPEEYRRRWPDE
jgi:putative PIN family toxin of toxin-antitoxin system